jgi:hypothetical protein
MFKEGDKIVCVRTSPAKADYVDVRGRVFKDKTYTFSHYIHHDSVVVKEVEVSVSPFEESHEIGFDSTRFVKQKTQRKSNSITRKLVQEYKEIKYLPEIEKPVIFN